jgi:hypothetical protein
VCNVPVVVKYRRERSAKQKERGKPIDGLTLRHLERADPF